MTLKVNSEVAPDIPFQEGSKKKRTKDKTLFCLKPA